MSDEYILVSRPLYDRFLRMIAFAEQADNWRKLFVQAARLVEYKGKLLRDVTVLTENFVEETEACSEELSETNCELESATNEYVKSLDDEIKQLRYERTLYKLAYHLEHLNNNE